MRLPRLYLRAAPPARRVGQCANCGAPVDGAYCQGCGQETRLELPTARAFLHDAFGRYVAFDGRLWRTLAPLLVRPGFLTVEYLAGRRRRYVRPGRLLLVLALALFAAMRVGSDRNEVLLMDDRAAAGVRDAAQARSGDGQVVRIEDLDVSLPGLDSPWLAPLRERVAAFRALDPAQKSAHVFNGVNRYGPYAFVALLPFFAVLMQLAYLGRSRRYPGRPDRLAAHLVFGAHNHAFLALMLLAMVLTPVPALRFVLWLWVLAYLPLSMKAVYGGPWSGVVLRAMVVGVAYLVVFAVVIALLFALAVLLG